MSNRLPLDLIEVQNSCPKDWNRMSGSDQKRFCDHCHRHVHNLSAMTESEAQELICREAGELCVRFTRLTNGKIKTLDYCRPTPRSGLGWRLWTVIVAVAAAVAACVLAHNDVPPFGTQLMGAVSMPTVPPPGTTPNTPPQSPPCQTP